MMNATRIVLGAAIAASLVAGTTGALAQGKKGVVKIGVNETLSGKFVAVGTPPTVAIRLAIHEINDKGGFKVGDTTYTFQPVEVDNRSEGPGVVAGMTKLIEDEKIKVVFGPTVSVLANQAQEMTVPAKVIHISAAGSWQSLGYLDDPKKPLLFGTQNPLTALAKTEIAAVKELGSKKVAYFGADDDTTKGNISPFLAEAKANGIEVITILFPYATADFSSFVSRAKAAKVDSIHYLHPQNSAPNALRAAVELDAIPKGFSGRQTGAAAALKLAMGKPVPVPYVSAQSTPDLDYPSTPKVKAYAERLKSTGVDLGYNVTFSFFTYDFVHMLAAAMTKAGTVEDTAKIAAAFGSMTYDGVAGKICFAKSPRASQYDGTLVSVRNGKVIAKAVPSPCK
jgi:ABC-type branched-subunit amino acid transport system substrate-binding protein